MTDWNDEWEWLMSKQRLVEAALKNHHDYLKYSVEYGKLLLNSLIIINSGGLVSLPTMAVFLSGPGTLRMGHSFLSSAFLYSFGLLMALISTFLAHRNFYEVSQLAIVQGRNWLHAAASVRGRQLADPNLTKSAEINMASSNEIVSAIGMSVGILYYGALFSGWLSLAGFMAGAIAIVWQLH